MSSNVEIFNVDIIPAISTCHVTRETAEQLDKGDAQCPWTIVAAYEHGWFLWVQPSDLLDELNLPADLREVMEWGNRHNLKWLRMDCDQSVVADLPQYDW
jgi:Leu/Phe-tRNA-protein transferase